MNDPFPRAGGELRCGAHRVSDLADRFGTPLYLYDLAAVRTRYRDLCAAFQGTDTLVAYSVKANGNLKLLSELAALGAGADIVSQGELLAVRTAGAYGFAMASNYNARPRPAEVMVDGDEVTLARARESLDDLLLGEWAPDLSTLP